MSLIGEICQVESGSHTDRKIFELAQAQASREAEVKASVTTREKEMLKLHELIRSKDQLLEKTSRDLASLQMEVPKSSLHQSSWSLTSTICCRCSSFADCREEMGSTWST